MDYQELLNKYNLLLAETERLVKENRQLKAQLKLTESAPSTNSSLAINTGEFFHNNEPVESDHSSAVTSTSDSLSKIRLFMSLFKGRSDVYARRWENKRAETAGYAPVCLNQWQAGLCGKPKTTCAKCAHKAYAPFDEHVIEGHLKGNLVAGTYPLLPDETCWFLAMDFDGASWQMDISMARSVCAGHNIPLAVERSRSGKGGHIWFFFESPFAASLARKFGSALVTAAMYKRHEIPFRSYDRLFPSQDTMPTGGLGNLIALPLQKTARDNHNSEFVDENFDAYPDQWAFLSSIQKFSEDRTASLINALCQGRELGELKVDDEEEAPKPWEIRRVKLQAGDFPDHIDIVRANMLYIPKTGISQRALNRLKRLACFKNPMFYRHQAMRLSTYGHPPVICCADETETYLCLPRGCETELLSELELLGIQAHITDKTNPGKKIDVKFQGELRDEQPLALEHLLGHDTGILSGTTAFGKTVVAIRLIAERKVNTLILVDKIGLLSQWKEKLSSFLGINEPLPGKESAPTGKRGRKNKISLIGQLGGGKKNLTGIIDIAVMQSLSRLGEVKDCVKNYGMVLADECHHAPAFSYENILKTTTARYVYGLTATPTRKDGHHPILLMHCGPIRYRDDARKQAEKRPFDHYIVPRFTSLRAPLDRDEKGVSIQELYSEIVDNEFRNQRIVEDVLNSYQNGRNCLVLSQRTAHVELLAQQLQEKAPDVVTLTGGMGVKTTREAFGRITAMPADKNLLLVATGAFIGEGFDEPRLDTLFLVMPISWKGTLQQYAGRLHRLFESKKEVRIYDYVDVHVRMLEKMYQKRLAGYAAMGYKAKGEDVSTAPLNIIFDKDNFLPIFSHDIVRAEKEILIVSPFVRKRRALQMMQHLQTALARHTKIIVVTRPATDYKPEDQAAWQGTLNLLKQNGIKLVLKANIHQKFAIMDQKVVWYGSINLLSYGSAQESIMRLESPNIAVELIKSIERPG